MDRGLRILLFLVLVVAPGNTFAQGEEGEDVEVEMFFSEDETVTSAARHEQEIGMSPSAITVISREDIETTGATNLGDLLRLVPGLDVIITSPAFTSVAARLDWTPENNHCLVLIDGREVNNELMGTTTFEILPVSVNDIERIEVIRGPGSSLYGANALSCVISITTRPIPDGTSAWVAARGGEVGTYAVAGRASAGSDRMKFALAGGGNYAGSFSDPRLLGMKAWRLSGQAEYALSDGSRLLLDGGFVTGTGEMSVTLSGIDGELSFGSLRLAYRSDDLDAQLFWTRGNFSADFHDSLYYAGIHLADFRPVYVTGDVMDGEVQWTLPRFYSALMIMLGASGRFSRAASDELLDGDSYADVSSPDYHKPGIEHFEARAGAFVHAELAPADWVTVTGGARFDYNTMTDIFISPRLAAVFRPAREQFVRLGIARSFRKPAFFETSIHPMVDFPSDSPLTGDDRDLFQEFMSRVLGDSDLGNEELIAIEAGYMGRFLDGRLSLSADLFYNIYRNEVTLFSNIKKNERGLPDLQASQVKNFNEGDPLYTAGGEFSIRYSPSKYFLVQASWTYREGLNRYSNISPKNLLSLGGRFRTEWGLLGSLYAFSRSEFWNFWLSNPKGILEDFETDHLETSILVLGKLGYRWSPSENSQLEVGLKLFLPISPGSAPYFRYYELGGGLTPGGQSYGGDLLRRMVTCYLEGSF